MEAFGQDVARFFEAAASDPEKCRHLDDVLAGSSMLRKHFAEAPLGAERVVMEVVSRASRYLNHCTHCTIFPPSGEPPSADPCDGMLSVTRVRSCSWRESIFSRDATFQRFLAFVFDIFRCLSRLRSGSSASRWWSSC